MNLKDEIDCYLSKVSDLLSKQTESNNVQNEMYDVVVLLSSEMETSRNNQSDLSSSLKKLTEAESFGLHHKYLDLKESYSNLKLEYEEIKSQNNIKETSFMLEIEDLRQTILQIEEKHENDLQVASAANAMYCDEKDTIHARQLVNANNKIKYFQNLTRNLQYEINKLKNTEIQSQFNKQKNPQNVLQFHGVPQLPVVQVENKRIDSLTYNNLSFKENDFESTNPMLFINDDDDSETIINKPNQSFNHSFSNNDVTSKDTTLKTSLSHSKSYPKVYKGTNKFKFKGKSNNTVLNNANPTKISTDGSNSISKDTNPQKKKRKLYNPDDLDHLDHLQID